MKTYHSSFTQSYKSGFIHSAVIDGHDVTKVQADPFAYVVYVKSIRAAKLLITKHVNSGKALVKGGAK